MFISFHNNYWISMCIASKTRVDPAYQVSPVIKVTL